MKCSAGAIVTGLTGALLASVAGGSGCRSTAASDSGDGGGGRGATADACPGPREPDPLRAWSGRFPVERGGVVAVVGGSPAGAARALQKWQAAAGISGVETSRCGGRLAVWIPGIACPEPPAVREALGQAGPLAFTRCLPPLRAEEIVDACARAALAAPTCAAHLAALASACRSTDSARCRRLAQLAARFTPSGARPDARPADAR
jgi:hypothetical protein